jgi:pimeloyl-ACP methyl ester carboxylesterase
LNKNERRLATLTIPVRVLWGADDAWIPVETGRRLAAMISSSSFQLIDRAGHLVQYDAPVALADEIRAWLDGRTGKPGVSEQYRS